MIKKAHKDFENPIKCWVCKKAYKEGEVKVKDHHHITGKYQEYLNISLSKNILVVFHKLKNYNSHLIFQNVGKHRFKINVLPQIIEKYMSFTNKQPKKGFWGYRIC